MYYVLVEQMSAEMWTLLSEEHRLSFIWVPLAGSCLEERSLPLVYRMNLDWERK